MSAEPGNSDLVYQIAEAIRHWCLDTPDIYLSRNLRNSLAEHIIGMTAISVLANSPEDPNP